MTGPTPVLTAAPPRRVAIMQPYLFPYLGYFQLVAAVDEFWLLDTVQFIQHGWMNRNALLVNGQRTLFTIPVNKRPRLDTIANKVYGPNAVQDCTRLVKTLGQSYAKAPHVDTVIAIVQDFARHLAQTPQPADFTTATETALQSCLDAIGLATPIRRISSLGLDDTHTGQDRIIAACQTIGAQVYVNMIGGRDLYKADDFAASGIDLRFLRPVLPDYDQGLPAFEPGLSILDVLAHMSPDDIRKMLDAAQIVDAPIESPTRSEPLSADPGIMGHMK